MKKLIIKVTPDQSRIAQEILFNDGYSWAGNGDIEIGKTNSIYLALNLFKNKALTHSCGLGNYAYGVEVIKFDDWIKLQDPIEAQRAKVAKHQAKLDQMIQEKIEADLKNSKVELKGGDWTVGASEPFQRASHPAYSVFGFERQTKELAESARKEIIRFQRMLAYVDDRGARLSKGGWTVAIDHEGRYLPGMVNCVSSPCAIRTTEECAKKLADDLNSGRFTLDLPE